MTAGSCVLGVLLGCVSLSAISHWQRLSALPFAKAERPSFALNQACLERGSELERLIQSHWPPVLKLRGGKDIERKRKGTREKRTRKDSDDVADSAPVLKKSKKVHSEDGPGEKKSQKKSTTEEPGEKPAMKKIDINGNPPLADFRIRNETLQVLKEQGITTFFPTDAANLEHDLGDETTMIRIQAATFDRIFDGKDLIARALTGTGKTLAFVIPVHERLMSLRTDAVDSERRGRLPLAIVLVPTRELCLQVSRVWKSIAGSVQVLSVYGGAPIGPQRSELRRGVDVVVGTPGRVLDLLNRGDLKLTAVRFLVMDEADQMLEIGFQDDMEAILKAVCADSEGVSNNQHQTMLFSATVPSWVQNVARKYLRPSMREDVDLVSGQRVATAKTIEHLSVSCGPTARRATIGAVVKCYGGAHGKTIVFTETKREADELSQDNALTVDCGVLHGDIAQHQREQTFKQFREGKIQCLVATNVAARGLDIPEVDLVVMCHPPDSPETYVHRAGRTGRAGKNGTCVVFFSPRESYSLTTIERRNGITFRRIGAPQPRDVAQAAGRDAMESMLTVHPDSIQDFMPLVERAVQQFNGSAERVVAAAIAVISGHTQPLPTRSMLTSLEGYKTLIIRSDQIHNVNDAFRLIRKALGASVNAQSVRLLRDSSGAAFDVPAEHNTELQTIVEKGKAGVEEAVELPELTPDRQFGSESPVVVWTEHVSPRPDLDACSHRSPCTSPLYDNVEDAKG